MFCVLLSDVNKIFKSTMVSKYALEFSHSRLRCVLHNDLIPQLACLSYSPQEMLCHNASFHQYLLALQKACVFGESDVGRPSSTLFICTIIMNIFLTTPQVKHNSFETQKFKAKLRVDAGSHYGGDRSR